MMTTETDNAPSVSTGTLVALRALAAEPPVSITDALRIADAQAQLLAGLMTPVYPQSLLARRVPLIPTVTVENIDDIPVPGTAFWARGCWHIHIRASDTVDRQNFTVLHALKHIIDYPLRRRPNALRAADWEEVADHFAGRVLAGGSNYTTGNHDLASKQQVPPQSTTKTGGVP